MTLLFAWAALTLAGCQGSGHPAPIVGSTYRIDEDRQDPESEIFLDVFTTAEDCANAKIDELDICRPMVDRAAGEVHLSFIPRDRETNQPFPLALSGDQVMVLHDRARQQTYELIPHDPRSAGQLYVVLIDGSGSMWEPETMKIEQVYKALMSKEVSDAFFPSPDARSGVLLLRFNDKLQTLDGGEIRIVQNKAEYRQLVKDHLKVQTGGFTHLFAAARDGMTTLLQDQTVRQYIASRQAQPTFILLTDGFNNEAGADTCSTNVDRLRATLDVIRQARSAGGTAKPVLYTVGLGRRYRSGDKPPGVNQQPTTATLCGARADDHINGGLERLGIDHVSLAWLAEAGGGVSFVKQNYRGLAEVFVTAAAKRYRWFEIRYAVPDPVYHRHAFDVRISLLQGYRSSTEVTLLPSPWFDAPTGTRAAGERWTTLTPLRHSLTVLMPALGLLVLVNFWGAAWFNAYRALFRRGKPRRR